MKFLIVVDMQNDFITGSLGTKEAEAILPKVLERSAPTARSRSLSPRIPTRTTIWRPTRGVISRWLTASPAARGTL